MIDDITGLEYGWLVTRTTTRRTIFRAPWSTGCVLERSRFGSETDFYAPGIPGVTGLDNVK